LRNAKLTVIARSVIEHDDDRTGEESIHQHRLSNASLFRSYELALELVLWSEVTHFFLPRQDPG